MSNPETERLLASGPSAAGRAVLVARGSWTVPNARALDAAIAERLAALAPRGRLLLDLREVTSLDTWGATLLAGLDEGARAKGLEVETTGLAEVFATLAAAVGSAAKRVSADTPAAGARPGLVAGWSRTARTRGAEFAEGVLGFLEMLGAVFAALVAAVRNPGTFRLTSTVHQLDRVAWQAVPIILLITVLIGGIIAQQGFFHFRRFGADQYVVDMVGILVLREIGVLLVAIMVAGRSGSSYTAELGSMKMREEIDALRTMGLDPVAILILPRVLALVLALPALTFIGALAALWGGGFVAWTYGGMSPDIFIARLREAISLEHLQVGLIKAPFMALVIGIVAATEGLRVRGSAESLGRHTTASVVKSIFLIIVIDGLFAIYFAAIGM